LEAASLTLVGGTVWDALVTRAQLSVHETILIHGGAGGVGTVAIQLAKAMGARVITTALHSNHAFVRSLGPDEVIDHTSDDYVSALADLTHGQGVNVIFDTVGGDTLTRSALALANAGRVVSIVDVAQPQNLIETWGKTRLPFRVHPSEPRQARRADEPYRTRPDQAGDRPVLPLARIGEAHELLEGGSSRGLRGKVAIDVVRQTVELTKMIDTSIRHEQSTTISSQS
jgi:NADPH2:quinone reductase